ncbi:MAG: glycosyltransferase [Chitinophagaceae bacterium]|nr:glycosyltransferase [Chitinophagaceae bacterium]
MLTVLYISYDGLTDALGQSQVLSLIRKYPKDEIRVIILSFEKKEAFEQGKGNIEKMISNHNIIWEPLFYTKKPPILSTIFDIYKGKKSAKRLHKKYTVQIIHCRGHITSIMGLFFKKRYGLKFIFDMRGWFINEKQESGYWDHWIYIPVYRYLKHLERKFFFSSDYIVSLTEAGKSEIIRQGLAAANKIGVIPTLVDFTLFKPFDQDVYKLIRKKLKIPFDASILIHSGSVGGNYDITKILNIFEEFTKKFPVSFLILLTKEKINLPIQDQRVIVKSVPYNQVSDYLVASDFGLIIYKPGFSTIGRSPTKLGEYWASGMPVISVKEIGDLESLFTKYKGSGISVLSDLSDLGAQLAETQFIKEKNKLRNIALEYYDEEKIKEFYLNIYRVLSPVN